MNTVDDILTEPAARRLGVAHDAAATLAAEGWRVAQAVTHSGGTADLAADRVWQRSGLSARVRLVVRCDARDERLIVSTLPDATFPDSLPYYFLGEGDPAQRRALAAILDETLLAQLHEASYPRELAVIEPARIDAPPMRTRAAAMPDPVLDEAFASVDAVRRDLLEHDLDVVRDDLEIDREFAVQAAIESAHRCELIHPIVITSAELWSLPEKKRRDWIRLERSSLVGSDHRWIDVVQAAAFPRYAEALTRHLNAAYRRRRFAPAGASSRS